MIKKSLLLTLLLAILVPWAAQAQETVEIGDGTSKGYYTPIGTYYNYAITEQLYTATEIGTAGTISSISFNYAVSTAKDFPITVYMANVDAEDLSTGISLADADEVFSGTLSVTGSGWATITLDTPFDYDGTSNLLIGVNKGYVYWYSGSTWYYTSATNMARYSANDNNAYDTSTVPATVTNNRPNIQMVITPSSGPVCEKPATFEVSNVTANSATLTWTGGSGTYNVEYKGGSAADWTAYLTNTTSTSANLTGLTPGTAYQYRVQSVCGSDVSGWKSVSFQTMFGIPINEAFATTSLPAGWAKYSGLLNADGTATISTTTYGWSFGTSNGVFDSHTRVNIYGTSCNYWLVTPAVLMENNVQLTFDLALTAYSGTLGAPATTGTDDRFTVLITTNGGETWTTLRQWDNAGSEYVYNNITSTATGEFVAIDLSSYAGQNIAIAFYGESTVSNADNNLHIDNMSIDHIPACAKPTGVAASDVTAHTATISWTSDGNAWQIGYSTDGFVTEQYVEVTENPYTLTGLAPETAYQVRVQNKCSEVLYSIFTSPVSFTTDIACPAPTGLAVSNITGHEATISWMSAANAWQICVNDDEENLIDVTETTYNFTGLAPETAYTVKVRANCGDDGYSDWTNNVSFTTAVACPAPAGLAVTTYGMSANFTWESDAESFDVAYSQTSIDNPDSVIIGQSTTTEFELTNYISLGDHYVWVRANCGSEGYSAWAGPTSFHIGYCVPNPSSHDGQGITGVSFGIGDYVVTNGDGSASLPASAPFYGDYSDMIGAVQAGVESTIAITTATGNYPYTFVIWVDFDNSLSFEDTEIVYIGRCSAGAGTLEANITVPADQAIGDYRMRIYGADSYFNGFYNSGTTNWNAAHDPCNSGTYRHAHDYTLRVLEAPSCLTPTNLAINYTGGLTAEVTWEGEAETYNIDVNGEVTEGVTSPYVLDSLELATTYAVKVQADCGEDGTSEWSNPVSFTTDICLPENQCEIYYSFTDQYDDSWNGAYINIVDATTQEVLYELTMPNGTGPYEGSFNVCDGREIQFVWVSGSYPTECGYVFTHFGTTILEKATNSTAPDAGVFFTYNVNCTPDPCTVPYELMSSNVSYNQATLSWTGYSDTYYVQYRTAELRSGDWTEVTANTTTLDLTGLVSETTYEWQVRTDCDSIVEWSEIVTFTTQGLIVWNNPNDWTVPDEEEPEDVTIPDNTTVLIPANCTAIADEITIEGDGQIIIEEGGELIHSNEVPVVFQMNVDGYQDTRDENPDNDGYRLIASPVYESSNNPSIAIPEAMLEGNYDLYKFEQDPADGLEWINHKVMVNNQHQFTTLDLGKGYLYANTANVFVAFVGQTTPTNLNVGLDMVYEPGHVFTGWNLLGNPYTATAYADRAYYVLDAEGDEVISAELGVGIAPMKGFFVEAGSAEDLTCTVSTTPQNNNTGSLNINLSQANTLADRAIVSFGSGMTLGKFQLNPKHTKVYIPQEGKDYAVVSASDKGEMPVSFKAEKNGNYTLSFTNKEVTFSYLRLIDNMTGVETNLLETPNYTFNARTTDYANRFRLVFATSSNDGDSFAYFNNGNLVINNEGQATLQVVDVMGRILRSESINGCASISVKAAPGVYMLRLINGNDVKVQKVIIK